MLQAGRWSTTAPPKVKLERKAMLSDEETRRRIFGIFLSSLRYRLIIEKMILD